MVDEQVEASAQLDLETFLPYRLNRLADRISDELAQLYEQQYGITVAQWRVLAWLSHRRTLTAVQIRQATHMDKARVSRAVKALTERGLVVSQPSMLDQRHHELQLTSAGAGLLRTLIPLARAREEAWLAVLSDNERQQLWQLVNKLEQSIAG
ncbi:MAG: MarR family winged helix-turn-helix transcriptional regulator [Saccharospirillum sp.]|nr:MarR family winged helix-turn-helix transcriptional regulator [Saccharospirillum sp.]